MIRWWSIDAAPATLVAEKEAARDAYLTASAFPLMPGARDAVQSLHRRGVMLGIVTGAGASAVHVTVARHFATSPFRTIVSGDDVARSKPAPDCYQLALQRLRLDASECVAIEDTATGLAAAHAAGLRCIVVPHALSSHHDVSRAAYVATDLADAVAWLFSDAAQGA
jgi:HAD superfamily hydrolase (TIGR01509 family)